MIKISYQPKREILIKIGKISPFTNICKVTKKLEYMNAEVEYIPNKHLLEIGSYRERLNQGFDNYVEDVALTIFEEIDTLILPKSLLVRVHLDDEYLSPWSVEVKK